MSPAASRALCLVAALGVPAAVALAGVWSRPALYRAEAPIAIRLPKTGAGTTDPSDRGSFIAVLGSRTVAAAALERARQEGQRDLPSVGRFVREHLVVDPAPRTPFVRLAVRASDPEVAARLATAVATEGIARLADLERERLTAATAEVEVQAEEAKQSLREATEALREARSRGQLEALRAGIDPALDEYAGRVEASLEAADAAARRDAAAAIRAARAPAAPLTTQVVDSTGAPTSVTVATDVADAVGVTLQTIESEAAVDAAGHEGRRARVARVVAPDLARALETMHAARSEIDRRTTDVGIAAEAYAQASARASAIRIERFGRFPTATLVEPAVPPTALERRTPWTPMVVGWLFAFATWGLIAAATRAHPRAPAGTAWAFALVAGLCASWFALGIEGAAGRGIIAHAIVLGVVLWLPIGWTLLSGRPLDLLSPPVLFSLFMVAGYLAPLPAMLAGTDLISEMWPYEYRSFESAVVVALRLATLAAIAFYIGYAIPPRLARSIGRRLLPRRFSPARAWAVGGTYAVVAAVCIVLLLVAIGGPAAFAAGLSDRTRAFAGLGYFVLGLLVPGLFVLGWWEHLTRERRLWTPWFWLAAPIAIAASALTATKANTFVILLAGVVLFHRLYRRVPPTVFLGMAALAVLAMAAFDFLIRDFLVRGWAYADQSPLVTAGAFLRGVVQGNFFQIQMLSMLVDAAPDRVPQQFGSSYLFVFAAPIPSSIWPEKWLPLAGTLTLSLWPDRWLDQGTTIPASLVGEMLLNGGPALVVVGMGLFGALYRHVEALLDSAPRTPGLATAYALLLALLFHYLRGEAAAVTVVLLMLALPAALAARLLATR